MRTVLKNADEAIHFWANRVQEEGRAASVFFRGDKLYSYGLHFCIGRHLPGNVVALTSRTYSVTTSRHQRKALNAVSHLTRVYCNDPAADVWSNRNAAERDLLAALASAEKPRIRQTTRDKFKSDAYHIAAAFNAYLQAVPGSERTMATREACETFDVSTLANYREVKVAADTERARRRAEDARETLAKWRAGEVLEATRLYHLPPALRMSSDGSEVQTSHGARIPVSLTARLWRLVQSARMAGREIDGCAFKIGDYVLRTVRPDGSIVVGCHDIAYSELEHIARLLEFVPAAA